MRDSVKENIRGLALLMPLLVVAIALIGLSRRDNRDTLDTPSTEASHVDSIARTTPHIVEQDTLPHFSAFDPNTADYRTLLHSGVPRDIAIALLRWREAGKVFRIKEDVAQCYAMTDSLYFLLEPYIVIGDAFRYKQKERASHTASTTERVIAFEPFMLDTVTAEYLRSIGFSTRRADLVIRYRDMIGGYRSIEEFKECYGVGDSIGEMLRPYIIFKQPSQPLIEAKASLPIEINSADYATLCSVKGIGKKSAEEILRYRELLGGYYSLDQITELDVVTEQNFQRILQQIYCDSAKIKKISINFASPKVLERHPYMTDRALRQIINHRQLKGGWSTVEELIEDNIFSEEQARRIVPYLHFGTTPE